MEDNASRTQQGHSTGTDETEGNKIRGIKKAHGTSNPLPKRLYSLPEAAHYLGRTLWSMRELIWKGSIPIVREGRRIFVDIADMEAYVNKHKTTIL